MQNSILEHNVRGVSKNLTLCTSWLFGLCGNAVFIEILHFQISSLEMSEKSQSWDLTEGDF